MDDIVALPPGAPAWIGIFSSFDGQVWCVPLDWFQAHAVSASTLKCTCCLMPGLTVCGIMKKSTENADNWWVGY